MNKMNRRDFVGAAGTMAAGTATSGLMAQSSERVVRVGCIGVGGRGSWLLAKLLKIEGVEIRALCDIDPARLAKAQAMVVEAGQKKPDGLDDWKKLLERTDIDGVVSALPVDLHAANYVDVIASGKDLYGEKPLARTLAECDRVVRAAKRGDVIFQVGFQYRVHPFVTAAVKQVHSGDIGELVEGSIHRSQSWGPLGRWFGKRERSGDWMVEQAVHDWDIMNWATQSLPIRAMGMGRSDLFRDFQPDRNVHDYYSAVVEYESGVLVNILHSWVSPEKFNRRYTRLIGVKGGVDFVDGLVSYRKEQKKPDRQLVDKDLEMDRDLLPLKAYINSIRTRKPPVASVETGHSATLAGLLVREAVYTKQIVTVKDLEAKQM